MLGVSVGENLDLSGNGKMGNCLSRRGVFGQPLCEIFSVNVVEEWEVEGKV